MNNSMDNETIQQFKNIFMYLFIFIFSGFGCYCVWGFFSSVASKDHSLAAVSGLLVAVASLVTERGL